jgi:hypothetical protein
MSDRLGPFSTDELAGLLFTLDIAATVDPLVPEAETIRRELIDELKTRGETGSTSKSEGGTTARDSQPKLSLPRFAEPLSSPVPLLFAAHRLGRLLSIPRHDGHCGPV